MIFFIFLAWYVFLIVLIVGIIEAIDISVKAEFKYLEDMAAAQGAAAKAAIDFQRKMYLEKIEGDS